MNIDHEACKDFYQRLITDREFRSGCKCEFLQVIPADPGHKLVFIEDGQEKITEIVCWTVDRYWHPDREDVRAVLIQGMVRHASRPFLVMADSAQEFVRYTR